MLRVRPNRHTLALGAMVLAMWYAGAAQQNGGAYLLSFLTASIVLVSWLHARANLRALSIHAGTIRSVAEGERVRLPLVLAVEGGGRVPCGVEITAAGAREPVFVEALAADHPVHAELQVPATAPGPHSSFTVIARSRYPLGFFTAERVMAVAQPHLVHPRAAGDLPLPQPTMASERQKTAATQAPSSRGMAGAGEDFAGVREWQPGDSLRQVDWKAMARGRPMVVKLWAGHTAAVVWLEWSVLTALQPGERASQLAAWIDQAETRDLRYGLRLPGREIQPGHGAVHRRQCLDALALQGSLSESPAGKLVATASPRLPTRETSARVPGHPSLLMAFSLAFAGLPLIGGGVPLAGVLVFYLALIVQWYRQHRKRGPCSQAWRLLVIGLGVAGTWLQGGTLFGLEAGVSIMLAVTAGKILEARNARDFQLVGLLGWFMCLCGLALEQALGRSLYVLASFALITATLVRFRRGSRGLKVPLKTTGTLLAQALPLVLLAFFLFPRGTGGMVMRLSRQLSHRTGISSSVDPGSVAEVAQSASVAFHVRFPEGEMPDISERYWRCLVLWDCQGLKWRHGPRVDTLPPPPRPAATEVRQQILIEPHYGTWLPALDTPTHVMSHMDEHSLVVAEGTLHSDKPVDSLKRYDVGSVTRGGDARELPAATRKAALQVPPLSPRVLALAESFKAHGTVDFKVAAAALNYFRTQGFRYTLEPDKYEGENAMDEFLFHRRLGFCEHFAATFATLMRQCGVPSRLVIGYLGGENNDRLGPHLIIKQSDAHAWCELWYEGRGWTRVDPTAALAPGRLSTDLRTYLEGGLDSAFAMNRNTWWGKLFTESQLFWDGINYQWYSRVVQFNEDDQEDLIKTWHLRRFSAPTLVTGALVLVLTPLLLVWLWLRRGVPHADPGVRAWRRFCAKLARAGVVKAGNEAPSSYTLRAALALPMAAAQIERIGELYVQLRYAGNDGVLDELKRMIRAFRVRRGQV